jgi:gluconate transporter
VTSTSGLLALVVLSVGLLLALLTLARLHAFIALLLTSLVVAVVDGIPLDEIAGEIQRQMGSTLGYIALVVGVGAMFGEMLRSSGAAHRIATALLARLGDRGAPKALALAGLVIAVPVFFDVALILFVPLLYSLARRSGRSLLYYAIPLLAGIAVGHSFIPPTPGPVAVAALLGADLGWVIAFGVMAGVAATAVGGLWFGGRVADRVHLPVPEAMEPATEPAQPAGDLRQPSVGLAVALLALPLVLILLGTVSTVALPEGSGLRRVLGFAGHPIIALLATALLSFWALGTRLGFGAEQVRRMTTRSLEPVGLIILVTGAGGVFGKVLLAAGVGAAAAQWMAETQLPLVVLGFAAAAVVRIAQGSATVAMVTTAGLLAPLLEVTHYPAPIVAATVVAVACGATVLSHVNDSGFWLVSRYLGMSERQTLRVWTVLSTLLGVTGFAVVLALSALF